MWALSFFWSHACLLACCWGPCRNGDRLLTLWNPKPEPVLPSISCLGHGIEISLGLKRKRPSFQSKSPEKTSLILNQEGVLGRENALTQQVQLVFILTQAVAVSLLHWLGFNLTGLSNWLIWRELAHMKWRRRGERPLLHEEKDYCARSSNS